MAGQQGFAYESRVHNRLNAGGFVPRGFTPAGSNSSAPDCAFIYGGTTHKLEVKLNMTADYGQGTLNYSQGGWSLGGAGTTEADEMRRLLRTVGVEPFVNRVWGVLGPPNKGTVIPEQFTKQMVAEDYRRFVGKFLSIPASAIHSYYAAKGTYYIQVGGYGLYYMAENPAGLEIPQFNPGLRIRIRTKRGNALPIYNYRFTTALQVTQRPPRSPVDIDRSVEFLKE
tara:strand:- start:451 stop:1128 length:678 start_codon:yes stop_codon:yes gene_type:complete